MNSNTNNQIEGEHWQDQNPEGFDVSSFGETETGSENLVSAALDRTVLAKKVE
jgi:hypothetical protein